MALYDNDYTRFLATEAEMDSADSMLYGGLAPGTIKNLASIYAGQGMTQSDVEQMMRNLGVQDSVLGSVMQGVTFAGAKPAATQGALQTATATQPVAAKSPLSFTLPTDWGVAGGAYDEAAEKINYYNTQGITPEALLASSYGITQSDIDWMRENGYTVGAGATQGALSGAADTVTSSVGTDTSTAGNQPVARSTASRSDSSGTGALAIVGDSLSSALGYDSSANAIGSLSDIFGSDVTNISRGGMTTTEALTGKNLVNDEASAFSDTGGTFQSFLDSSHPGKVVLRYGAADAAIMKDPATTISNLDRMIQMTIASGSTPVLTGIPPVATSGDPRHGGVYGSYFDFMPPLVDEINRGMQGLANKYGLQFIDLSGVQIPNGGLLDGLHPDAATGALIANEIKRQLAGPSTVVGASGTDTVTSQPSGALQTAVSQPDYSAAYLSATGQGGIGLDAMNQNIRDFFAGSPTEAATRAAMAEYGLSDADILRATGKSLADYFPVGALPTAAATPTAATDTATSSALSTAATTASTASQDTTATDLKNFVTQNIADPQAIARYAQRLGSSVDDLALAMNKSPEQVRQYFRDAGFPLGTMLTGTLSRTIGTDTGIRQLDKGEDVVAERAIGMQGNKVLVQQYDAYGQPTGTRLAEPNAPDYVGWIQALGLVLPGALSGVGEAIGSALGATGAAASAIGSGAINFALQIAGGADPIDALKGAVISAGAGFVGSQVSSMLPAELAGAGKNAITQLITTGKLDPAALATSVGTSFATDALAAETGVDRATAGKLVTAGLQALQGNELAALTSLAQAGIQSGLAGTGVTAQSPQDRAAFLDANAEPQGAGALSPIAAEDEQIAIQQRQNAANQALTDYLGPGNDLSREGLVSQLQSLGLTADQAENYAKQADQKINMRHVGADVMNRYSKIDPEFGTPQLDRNTAVQELVAAGYSSEHANEILNDVDAQNASKLANRLNVQAAYNDLIKGTGTAEQLRSAMMLAGYTDAQINNQVTKGLGILEGSKLTAGEQAQERVSQLPDVRAEIAAKQTFSEAYKLARDTYGSGATFTWQGKSYSTDTFQENPALGLVPVAGSGRGQAAGKTAEQEAALLATAEQLKKIDPVARASLLDSASVDYGAVSPEGNAQGLTQTAADRLVQSAIPVNAIKTAFGMTTEAAGNALKAFGTVGESLGFNTAQMSDYGRKLENIAQELYPQALKSSEDEVKGRFANAKTTKELGQAIVDSVLNNPGALLKMGGVELIQEAPNIALALATGGTSALIRYGGLLAGIGLDVVESAGLQGAQKVDEGLAKGLTRAQAVKGAVDDMKAAGAVTAIMTAAADKVPFGGTIAKTMIKGSASEGTEEYIIARATGQDHMSALRQAAFGALIGGPTEATLQGAGNLTNVTINGDTMIGTYADGTKVSISEPAGATSLKIDIIKPTDTSVNVSNTLTADFTSGTDLTTSINNVVSNNITADLSGTIDSTVKAVIDNDVDLSKGVTDLTSAAVTNTGDTKAVINNVVSSLASNGTDLNANAGSIVTGAVSGGASVTDAVDTTLKAVTANGGNVADAAASIITSVSASGDTAQVANATTAVVNAAITSGSNVTATTSNAVDAALAASGGSTDAVTQVVGGVASQGNNDATAAAVASAVTTTGDTSAAVNAALTNGGAASTVLSTASNAAITAGTDANTAVTNTLTSALSNNVDTATAVDSTVKGALDAGADASVVVNSAITAAVTNNVDTASAITNTVTAALDNNADVTQVVNSAITTAVTNNVDTTSAITNTVTAALDNNADVTAVVDSAIKTSLDNGVDTAAAVTSVITAALNNNADVSSVVSSVISTAVNNGADTSAVVDSTIKAVINAGADVGAAIDSVITASLDSGGNTASVITSTVDTAISNGADASTVVAGTIDASIKAGGDVTSVVDTTIKAAIDNGGDIGSVIDSSVKAGINAGSDASVVIDAAINAGITSGADTGSVIDSTVTAAINSGADTGSVIDSTVTAAINSGADTGSVIDSTIKAAVTAGTDSTTAIDSTLTAVANAGGDVSQAVGSAVDASLAAGADTSQTLIAATSTAITNGGDASTVVSNVVNSAVENGASLADATASSVATAIVSGADANAVIQTLTNSNSNLTVESGSSGDVTTVLASDGTSNTQVTMDAGSQTVTTTTTDTTTGETKQVTIQGDTTTTVSTDNSGVTTSVTVDENTGVKTEITSDAGSVTSTTQITDPNTGSKSTVVLNESTGVNNSTVIETKTGVIVDTTTDTNTGSTTSISTDLKTGTVTTTTSDPTLGTVTKVTETVDETSTTTKDTSSNVTTNVTVNTSTNTTTETRVNSDTGEVVVTEVVTGSGEVVKTETKTVEDLTPEEIEKIEVRDPEPVTAETVKTAQTASKSTATPSRATTPTGGGGMLMGAAPTTTSKIEMPEEAWLGGRFRTDLPSLAAMFPFLFPSQEKVESDAFSALRRASGVEPQVPKKEDMDYYAYGKEPSIDSVLEPYLNGGSVQKYAQGGIIMPSALQAATGGTPHKGSHYVQGAGGGQDDLIPARLADGEYVFDAEIVAALGDGSNKEGARRLDAMREAIRKHKRSGSLKKIPPPAKNPLAYFKEANK